MPTPILMPALSPTMTEGNLARWLKNEGDAVKSGDVIAEIETDKATMEVEAVDEGTLGRILVQAGTEGVKVNEPIAMLLGEGEDKSALEGAEAPKPAPKQEAGEVPAPAKGYGDAGPVDKAVARSEPEKRLASPAVGRGNGQAGQPEPSPRAEGDRVFASPLARRMAQQAGLDLAQLKGTGPHGRIVKADIEAALSRKPEAARPAERPAAPAPAAGPQAATPPAITQPTAPPSAAYEEIALSNMR
jgi:pyruvate dehydrogenase E2 component (dihydrolipoamide acetyltransferase)